METAAKPQPVAGRAALTQENYEFVRQYLHRLSGIALDGSRQYLVESRLASVVRAQRLQSLDALCAELRRGAAATLQQQVINALTTNETLFFRDPAQYEALRTVIVPHLLEARRAMRRLNVWSAACSTGQEAYSFLMMWRELGLTGWSLSVLGTDLSEEVLSRARAGRYQRYEVERGLSTGSLARHFTRQGTEWAIKEELRQGARFQRLDLRHDAVAGGPFDIIFCRNVLIYFDVETRRTVLERVTRLLRPGGCLLLGSAEAMTGLEGTLERRTVAGAVVYQRRG